MKALNRYLKSLRATAKKGFTLIELAIVGLFLGLLAVFAISQFSGAATDNTRAVSLFEASAKIADNWSLLSQQCGISRDIAAVAVSDATGSASTAAKNLSLLLGNAGVATTYQTCHAAAGIRPLTGLSAGGVGEETVSGMKIEVDTVNGSRYMTVTYKAVPSSVFNAAAIKYAGVTTAPAATAAVPAPAKNASAVSGSFAYTAEVGGTRDVTFIRPL